MDYISYAAKVISSTAPVLVKWRYPESRMHGLIDLDVSPEGDGFRYDAFTQEATCWFEVTNRSPFPVIADRISLRIVFANTSASIVEVIPSTIASAARERVHVSGTFLRPAGDSLRAASAAPTVYIEAVVAFRSPVREFVYRKYFERLKNVEVVNIEAARTM
jgi:hypothetical protein